MRHVLQVMELAHTALDLAIEVIDGLKHVRDMATQQNDDQGERDSLSYIRGVMTGARILVGNAVKIASEFKGE
jgi:hypothetical protein